TKNLLIDATINITRACVGCDKRSTHTGVSSPVWALRTKIFQIFQVRRSSPTQWRANYAHRRSDKVEIPAWREPESPALSFGGAIHRTLPGHRLPGRVPRAVPRTWPGSPSAATSD